MQWASSYCHSITNKPALFSPSNSATKFQKRAPISFPEKQVVTSNHRISGERTRECLVAESFPLPQNAKTITSTSNPFVKHCVKLRQSSSYRLSHGLALVVGTTLIREIHEFHVLKQDQQTEIECLFLLDKAEYPPGISDIPGERVRVSSLVMKKLAGVQSTESIEAIALMRVPSTFLELDNNRQASHSKSWFPCHHRILVLEGIQDPGNLGTLLRSALAFNWDGVFLLAGCCDPFNEKALRASRGAAFQIPIVSGSWMHLEALLNEVSLKMIAGHPDSTKTEVSKLSQELANSLAGSPFCLILGSEGSGLSEKAKKSCELVSIPMSGYFESLNVAVAGGIFMFVLKSDIRAPDI